jgi:hypothetical protein
VIKITYIAASIVNFWQLCLQKPIRFYQSCWIDCKQDKQYMCNETLMRPLLQCSSNTAFCLCYWATRHCQTHKNTGCCKTMLLWKIYVAGNSKTDARLHVKWPMLHWNKKKLLMGFFRRTIGLNRSYWHIRQRIHLPMKMEQTQCSETSAIKHHTPENNVKVYTWQDNALFLSFCKCCSETFYELRRI